MIEKIKIASLVGDFGLGGTARQIVTIDKYLNKDYFEHFIIIQDSGDNTRIKFLEKGNYILVSKPEDIASELKKNGINILYVHRHGRNQPEHDALARQLPPDIILIELNTFSALDRGDFGARCDKHVFVSRTNVLKYLKQNGLEFDFKKQKVVHVLIDSENFLDLAPSAAELDEYKKKMGLEGYFVVGRIARSTMTKWDDKTIVFWKKICQKNSKIKFVLYGVPAERKKQLEDAGLKENLIIMEPTADDRELALFYSSLDVLLHLSPIGECSCGTIAEAMLFGKPVVTSPTPFPKRAFFRSHTKDNGQIEQINNGINGFVANSAEALALSVLKLYSNPGLKDECGENNRAEVLIKYDVKVGIKTLEKIFIESAKEKSIELSPEIEQYDRSIHFYPAESDIIAWKEEYYQRLKDVFCASCRDGIDDYIFYLSNIIIRKAKTLRNILRRMI